MPTKLYVSNLSPNCNEADLNGLFSKFGAVAELDIVKNYAFVHMESHGDAQKAVASLNNQEFRGGILSVQFSKIQNINRGNKATLRDRHQDGPLGNFRGPGGGPGRDFGGRGGFHDGGNFRDQGGYMNRDGGDFGGGRGGLRDRGGRGLHGHGARDRPYDRNQSSNQRNSQPRSQDFVQNSNLKPIRAAEPADFERQGSRDSGSHNMTVPPQTPDTPSMHQPAPFGSASQAQHGAPAFHAQVPSASAPQAQPPSYSEFAAPRPQIPQQQSIYNVPMYQSQHAPQPVQGHIPSQGQTARPHLLHAQPSPMMEANSNLQYYAGMQTQTGMPLQGGMQAQAGIPSQAGMQFQGGMQSQTGIPSQVGMPLQGGMQSQAQIPPQAGIPSRVGIPLQARFPSQPGIPSQAGNPSQAGIPPQGQPAANASNFPGTGMQQTPQPSPGQATSYTVYERYVDYRNPLEMGVPAQPTAPAAQMYQQPQAQPHAPQYPVPTQVPVNKDPYANAQLQFARYTYYLTPFYTTCHGIIGGR